MIVLDTCIISETIKPNPDKKLIAWIESLQEEDVYLPCLVLGELKKGIELLESGKRKSLLALWFEQLRSRFEDRVLVLDEETAITWGILNVKLSKQGKKAPAIDSLIAAMVLRHNAVLATLNVADFRDTGIQLFNPCDPQ